MLFPKTDTIQVTVSKTIKQVTLLEGRLQGKKVIIKSNKETFIMSLIPLSLTFLPQFN